MPVYMYTHVNVCSDTKTIVAGENAGVDVLVGGYSSYSLDSHLQ